jgi:hypothetical protein
LLKLIPPVPYNLFADCAVDGQREYLEDDLPWGCHRTEAGESRRIAVEERDGGWERGRERRVMEGEGRKGESEERERD